MPFQKNDQAAEMLPSLTALALRTDAPKPLEGITKKKKSDVADKIPVEPNTIYYSSNQVSPPGNAQYKLLSNLYGVVEWGYQIEKFATQSEAHQFLKVGLEMERCNKWTEDVFNKFRFLFEPGKQGKTSYQYNGRIATGHLAQLMSKLVTDKHGNDIARRRLTVLRMRFDCVSIHQFDQWMNRIMKMSEEDLAKRIKVQKVSIGDYQAWRQRSIAPELEEYERDAVFMRLLREKFNNDAMYKELLLSTGMQTLHEKTSKDTSTMPNVYQYLTPSQRQRAASNVKGAQTVFLGGDLMGRLLMRVRDEIRAGTASRSDEPSCSTDAPSAREDF